MAVDITHLMNMTMYYFGENLYLYNTLFFVDHGLPLMEKAQFQPDHL